MMQYTPFFNAAGADGTEDSDDPGKAMEQVQVCCSLTVFNHRQQSHAEPWWSWLGLCVGVCHLQVRFDCMVGKCPRPDIALGASILCSLPVCYCGLAYC